MCYGSGTYSEESNICMAAMHSGAVTSEGGNFILKFADTKKTYERS